MALACGWGSARGVRRPSRPPSKPATEEVRFHRPDLILLNDPPQAIEVQLNDKSPSRLDELMRTRRRSLASEQFGRVRCLCSPHALPYVSRAVERTASAVAIDVAPLGALGGFAAASRDGRSPLAPGAASFII